jgi:protein-disulfide isomerase
MKIPHCIPNYRVEEMNMSRSKRQEIRNRQKRNQQIILIGMVTVGVLLMALALIRGQTQSIGEIVQITPVPRPMANGVALGNPEAPVTIDVFEDFQCPACASYTEQVEHLIISTYVAAGQVYYVFHNFPFIDDGASSKESDQAASASLCADEQDRFWDYHDMLFANWNGENVGAFADVRLKAFAETLGLDTQAFNECLDSARYMDVVNADYQLGTRMGVRGTPSVFVNGVLLTPGYIPSIQDVQQAVEAVLLGQ